MYLSHVDALPTFWYAESFSFLIAIFVSFINGSGNCLGVLIQSLVLNAYLGSVIWDGCQGAVEVPFHWTWWYGQLLTVATWKRLTVRYSRIIYLEIVRGALQIEIQYRKVLVTNKSQQSLLKSALLVFASRNQTTAVHVSIWETNHLRYWATLHQEWS